jgi:hypothetical protein
LIDEQPSQQNKDKDAVHTFEGMDAHIIDSQAIFLVEAIGMFDLWSSSALAASTSSAYNPCTRYPL